VGRAVDFAQQNGDVSGWTVGHRLTVGLNGEVLRGPTVQASMDHDRYLISDVKPAKLIVNQLTESQIIFSCLCRS